MEVKEYWNSVSNEKEFTTPFQIDEFSKYVDKKGKILDIGCGYGRTLNELYNVGYKNLIGIDFSEGMIKRAKEKYHNIDFYVKNGEKLDIKDSSIDGVILLGVLTCIVSGDKQKGLINEIYRVLKKGGIIYINDFLLNEDKRNKERYEKYKDKYGVYGAFELSEGGSFRHHTEKWIDELLYCFKQKCFNKLVYKTMNGHTSNGFYYIGSKNN